MRATLGGCAAMLHCTMVWAIPKHTVWMPERCRGCRQRELGWDSCRGQAFALTGDSARTDPACALASDHTVMANAIAQSAIAGMSSSTGNRAGPSPSARLRPKQLRIARGDRAAERLSLPQMQERVTPDLDQNRLVLRQGNSDCRYNVMDT
jgi:hypothetical protein